MSHYLINYNAWGKTFGHWEKHKRKFLCYKDYLDDAKRCIRDPDMVLVRREPRREAICFVKIIGQKAVIIIMNENSTIYKRKVEGLDRYLMKDGWSMLQLDQWHEMICFFDSILL